MRIRKATIEDTEQLKPLFAGSLRNMAQLQPRQYREAEQDVEFIQEGILGEDSDVLVAEKDGQIIGLASVFSVTVNPRPYRVQQTYCELDTIFVQEEYRNQGVGKALLDAAWNWAKARNHASLQLMTLGENKDARRFYERAGMREHKIVYIFEND